MRRKTALITGSSKGLGRSLALAYACDNYNIILHGRDEKRLLKTQEDIIFSPGFEQYCYAVIGDITSEKTINSLYQSAIQYDIDILINNAGLYAGNFLGNMTSEEIERIIDVNLIAPIQLIKRIYPIFQKKKEGLIININSMAGKYPNELEVAYCASKHGLRGFSTAFQNEANRDNIRLIDVYLGAMQTEMTKKRSDYDKFIKTEEVADLIFRISKEYKSLRITEVDLIRRKY